MKTLALVQGDLAVGTGSYLTYSGVNKISQDLSLALREAYGGDRFHPSWGSILQQYVGTPMVEEAKAGVVAEVTRVLNNYITVQNAQIQAAGTQNVQSTLTTDDVVQSITSINATQVHDSLVVTVTLQTLSRQAVSITQVVS